MTYEIFLIMAIGVVATHTTNLLKRKWPYLGAREIQLVVFAICFAASLVVTLVRQFAPEEFLAAIGVAFASAVAWYEVAIKEHE